jgi:hypothetical protein
MLQQIHRHDARTVAAERGLDTVRTIAQLRTGNAEHATERRAIQIGIERANACAAARECNCEVRCDGAFADATLPAHHRNDSADLHEALLQSRTLLDHLLEHVRGSLMFHLMVRTELAHEIDRL